MAGTNSNERMEKIVSLCRRRGFVFQSSEIYGGLNGLWDYGPLGIGLKRNIKEAWWRDMVTAHNERVQPEGAPRSFQMVGIETSIIMHPRVWKTSGHYDLFHDMMVDCRESKRRYRHDHIKGAWVEHDGRKAFVTCVTDGDSKEEITRRALQFFQLKAKYADKLVWHGDVTDLTAISETDQVLAPDAKELGTLTEPREFNLMFETHIGAMRSDDSKAFLRPETAQGMFVNFRNVVDSSRVKVPFGIAQQGKSFRNEITPRNFTFRTREFEQMEMEFFVKPGEDEEWHQYWIDERTRWYVDLGVDKDNLRHYEHAQEKLSHYSKRTVDIEYRFKFAGSEWGELEGIANRTDFDLSTHAQHSGKDLQYFDQAAGERYTPYVIEPAAGLSRSLMTFLVDAYHEDEAPDGKGGTRTRTVLRLDRRLAPVKAAVLPLSRNADLTPKAKDVAAALRRQWNVEFDDAGSIGKRYSRHDEIGTPFCVTVDFDSLDDHAVTVRERDTMAQERVSIDALPGYLAERLVGC